MPGRGGLGNGGHAEAGILDGGAEGFVWHGARKGDFGGLGREGDFGGGDAVDGFERALGRGDAVLAVEAVEVEMASGEGRAPGRDGEKDREGNDEDENGDDKRN
jgi:hypothetical protein